MKRRGLVDEAALGLAEAVWSDRAFAGVVLVVSTLLFRDVRWIVGAAYLAGAALRGSSWKLRWPLFLAAGFVLWTCMGPFVGTWSADLLTGSRWVKVGMPLRVAVLLTCAGAGMRSLTLTVFGVALAIGACVIRGEAPEPWMAALAGVSVVILALGALGWPRTGFAIGVLAAVGVALDPRALPGWFSVIPGNVSHLATVVPGVALAAWTALAGRAGRAPHEAAARPESARLIVACQRFSWPAVSAVAVLALFHDVTVPLMSGGNEGYETFESLMAVSLGASLVACLGLGSRGPVGGLAAALWLSTALMVTWAVAGTALRGAAVGWTAFAVLWPIVIAQILRNDTLTLRRPGAFHLLLAALAVLPGVVFYFENRQQPSDLDWPWRWEWLGLAPIAFHAAMGLTAPSRRIVLAAVGLGATSMLATAAASAAVGHRASSLPMHRDDVLASVGVWFLGGVYVVIARRARSLSAVPLEADD